MRKLVPLNADSEVRLAGAEHNNRVALSALTKLHLIVQKVGTDATRETNERRSALRAFHSEKLLRAVRAVAKDIEGLDV